jgi:hypothetical protein
MMGSLGTHTFNIVDRERIWGNDTYAIYQFTFYLPCISALA